MFKLFKKKEYERVSNILKFDQTLILRGGQEVQCTGDFAIGNTVSVISPDGTLAELMDDTYILEDGTSFTVTAGVITEINDVQETETAEETTITDTTMSEQIEEKIEEKTELQTEEIVEQTQEEVTETVAEPVIIPDKFELLENKFTDLEARLVSISETLNKYSEIEKKITEFHTEFDDRFKKLDLTKKIEKVENPEIIEKDKKLYSVKEYLKK